MAESTLNILWKEYQARVATFLGWGRGALYSDTAWTTQQQFELDGIVASGLRQFYFPPPVDGMSYDWTFLKPVGLLTLASGSSTVLLPDDFGQPEGQVTVKATSSQTQPWEVQWCNEPQIREKFAVLPTMTGPPQLVALQPLKGTTANASQRFQLVVFPTSDQAYTLQLAYYLNPDYLSTPFPYAYGGAQHAETILESCLAIAEQRLDDAQGVHAAKFEERLKASIAMDRKSKPARLGYNRDNSDMPEWSRDRNWTNAITYNGNSF